jgi:hypothetical protein
MLSLILQKSALFSAYLDESEDPATRIFVVGGFVGRTEVWDHLQPKWLACLPDDISYFHATDCFSRHGQFACLDLPSRIAILDMLTDLIVSHDVALIGYGIDSRTYKRLAPKPKHNDFLTNKYSAVCSLVVQMACEAMGNGPTMDRGPRWIWNLLEHGDEWEQCDFFIENHDTYNESAKRAIQFLRGYKGAWWRDRIGAVCTGEKDGLQKIPLLQAADLGAFLAAKKICECRDGAIPWRPYYRKLEMAGRIYRLAKWDEASLNALYESLEEAAKESAEGGSLWDEILRDLTGA